MSSSEQGCAQGHEVCDCVVAISNELVEDAGDKGEGFGVVESDAASQTALSELTRLCDQELVDLCMGVSLSVALRG